VHLSSALLILCGGFLLAVLWFDLMFDVQVLRHRRDAALPEPVLASIAAYYRRVTTAARPMGHAVGAVMGVLLVTLLCQLALGIGRPGVAFASLLLAAPPILLAGLRVVPNAVQLGARGDDDARQSALARSICRDHGLCIAGILAFVALQLFAVASASQD
jgi:hypothetical protein